MKGFWYETREVVGLVLLVAAAATLPQPKQDELCEVVNPLTAKWRREMELQEAKRG